MAPRRRVRRDTAIRWLGDPARQLTLLAALAVLMGIGLRVWPVLVFGFDAPYDRGGLYMAFARQIYLAGFRMPAIIPHYTMDGMPFGYPPLAFYIEALFVYVLGVPMFVFSNGAPVLLTLLAILLFSALLLRSGIPRSAAFLGVIAYALCYEAFKAQTAAAGLSEALGTCAHLVLVHSLWLLQAEPLRLRYWIYWAAAAAFSVLAGPGSAMAAILLSAVFAAYVMIQQATQDATELPLLLGRMALGSILVLALTAFYWWPLLQNHGVNLLADTYSGTAGGFRAYVRGQLHLLRQFRYLHDNTLDALALVGLVLLALLKKPFVPAWFLLLALIPHERAWMIPMPGSLLVGAALAAVWGIPAGRSVHLARVGLLVLAFAGVAASTSAMVTSQIEDHRRLHLDAADVADLVEMGRSVPSSGMVVFLADGDAVEWGPLLLERAVVNVRQGTEWTPKERRTIQQFSEAVEACSDVLCVDELVDSTFGMRNYYLIVDRRDEAWAGLLASLDLPDLSRSGRFVLLEMEGGKAPASAAP